MIKLLTRVMSGPVPPLFSLGSCSQIIMTIVVSISYGNVRGGGGGLKHSQNIRFVVYNSVNVCLC